ncbi:VOC family protein [Nonomuraea roseoviolacea]|uniref:Catechol 2,3-dioxygenase-like lactoylglutathione lyase family enzyme n=1 Tax=Nonomuraea roseoviolacea subsp. carminata TaxID=160689 RepID=A0ABT1K117_9ACTN|nr:VOC family protein [Nonomuraea roseoviolacea]MCP2347545.1 catechol 2,3-dioxygenase-like lactoylglutathione lyase family enzyme [Nonomuraea roseoviolacea subsp. carminata]
MNACDIDRIDHSVLYTTDMDTTAATYEALGFTLTPLSMHLGSDRPGGERRPMGAGNRCALFGATYLELLGLFGDGSVDPWNIRPLIAQYEGLHGCSFGCEDAVTVERRLRAAGLSSSGVLPLQRDVETPEGVATARFEAIHLDRARTPEGLVHIARHLTPELIHQPRYLKHANGATHLHSVLLVVDDADLEATVARYARTLGVPPTTEGPRHVLALQVGRMEIVAMSAFDEVLPGEPVPALPYLAGQAVAVGDLRAARDLVEGNGFTVRELPDGFFVGAGEARGAAIAFVRL